MSGAGRGRTWNVLYATESLSEMYIAAGHARRASTVNFTMAESLTQIGTRVTKSPLFDGGRKRATASAERGPRAVEAFPARRAFAREPAAPAGRRECAKV